MRKEWLENLIVFSYKVFDTCILLNIFSNHCNDPYFNKP